MTATPRAEAPSVARVVDRFRSRFGRPPSAVASAPARVNIIGEHTDYNGGEVLPIGIAQRTLLALGPIDGSHSIAVSANEPAEGAFDAAAPRRSGGWWDYVAGTIAELDRSGTVRRSALGTPLGIAVASDVPAGAGLSSSAALEVATATALAAMERSDVPLERLADAAHRAENEFVGVASGIMDQYASALARTGHALHLWCDTAAFEHVPMRDSVLVFDTASPRALRTSAFNERRAECEAALERLRVIDPSLPHLAAAPLALVDGAALPEPLARRARHVATEMARVRAAVRELRERGSIDGDLLLASHASLRDDYECSTPELDWFVERVMREPGVRGARLTGAGWGGCAIAVGGRDALEAAASPVAVEFVARFGREPRYWVTEASRGASVERTA
jgi:galactokinase